MTPAERRLAESRAEIESLLAGGPDTFPRSQTMRYLMGGKGKMVALGVFAGLLAVKPRLAMYAGALPAARQALARGPDPAIHALKPAA